MFAPPLLLRSGGNVLAMVDDSFGACAARQSACWGAAPDESSKHR
jgi:hypothetical protein